MWCDLPRLHDVHSLGGKINARRETSRLSELCGEQTYEHIVNGLSRFDSLQFIKNSGKLIFERFIHFGVALYNNVSAETTAVAVFLFGKSRHGNCLVNMLVFFGRNTEANGDTTETVVFIKQLTETETRPMF